jgi:hypothetical protein
MNSPGVRRGAELRPSERRTSSSAEGHDTGLPLIQLFPAPDGLHTEAILEEAPGRRGPISLHENDPESRGLPQSASGSNASRPGLQAECQQDGTVPRGRPHYETKRSRIG